MYVEQVAHQMEGAHRRLSRRLQGLTDAEYLWEPVATTWTVRRREDALSPHPMGGGDWVFDWSQGEVVPSPFTTIAWRLMHLTDVLGSYGMVLRGEEPTDTWMEPTPSAAAGIALWHAQADSFMHLIRGENDESLARPFRVPWWSREVSRGVVIGTIVTETIHHGAEIGVLRDLYAQTSA